MEIELEEIRNWKRKYKHKAIYGKNENQWIAKQFENYIEMDTQCKWCNKESKINTKEWCKKIFWNMRIA